jgi:hypothetical protein
MTGALLWSMQRQVVVVVVLAGAAVLLLLLLHEEGYRWEEHLNLVDCLLEVFLN